jgi:hypothetical protein
MLHPGAWRGSWSVRRCPRAGHDLEIRLEAHEQAAQSPEHRTVALDPRLAEFDGRKEPYWYCRRRFIAAPA